MYHICLRVSVLATYHGPRLEHWTELSSLELNQDAGHCKQDGYVRRQVNRSSEMEATVYALKIMRRSAHVVNKKMTE